ncbi:MAG: transcription-repair coupling factor [Lachnospiraceae bacterium]|nr:transcription-repair coupling factor [Lachnospiraceae bacterium]
MRAIEAALLEIGSFRELKSAWEGAEGPLGLVGPQDAAKGAFFDALSAGTRYRLIITHNELRCRELAEEYRFYDRNTVAWPSKDVIFFQADIHSNEIEAERLRALRRRIDGRPMTLVAAAASLLTPQLPLEVYREARIQVDRRKPLSEETLIPRLIELGYQRTPFVEAPGQYAVRGDILDVFDLTQDTPYRFEFWGDEITSIRSFDILSQRSFEKLETVTIYPATELILTQKEKERGLARIAKEAAETEEKLRGQMLTKEAHRLKADMEALLEAMRETPGSVNADPYLRYFCDRPVSLPDYFPPEESAIFLDEPARVLEQAREIYREFAESQAHRTMAGLCLPGEGELLMPPESAFAALGQRRYLAVSALELPSGEENLKPEKSFFVHTTGIPSYNNDFASLAAEVRKKTQHKEKVILISGIRSRAKRLVEELRDFDITAFYNEDPMRVLQPGETMLYYGQLTRGFALPEARFSLISEGDIFTQDRKQRRKKRSTYRGEKIGSFAELKPGDYVVHEDHGLGIYRGIEKIETDAAVRDYVKVEYGDGGILYVLATGVDVLQKYAAGADEEGKPRRVKLNRLGGTEWQHTKSRVRSAVDEIAQDLVELYARRQGEKGFAFGRDSVWQKEFEDSFPFEETADQLDAIEAVKEDMESSRIMDRLICGDVGFGKTEIAIRAAFKAVQDGKQVALLVPTTILAQQHYNTFVRRMQNYPVRIELLSRFRTQAEQKKTVEGVGKGTVDIVIGTHRLLSKDMHFSDLGLLIVDEEQRFGVAHKEKIKKLRENVDVLTLSATPIPRTLHMSLVGIRDMSLLEEAPNDRLPIQTYVTEYHEELVREAITRELARKGQVYYVYNRVNRIAETAASLQALIPNARIAYAHGQMPEHELEKIMYDFIDGQIDVLVSTTIIETGLDIPNVNTMIIHDADKMGLSQLYQLRGRVGRSNRTAYAFLLYQRDKLLREVAEKRLLAIREFTDLGSGYKIAMRDLEIRGAGNLLGKSQSGHIREIGYDLYCKLLSQAVREKKEDAGEPDRLSMFTTSVDLTADAFIPAEYILNEEQKLEVYKRIASVEGEAEKDDMTQELNDRFGTPPQPVENLLRISVLRGRAHRLYIVQMTGRPGSISVKLRKDAKVNAAGIAPLLTQYNGSLTFYATGTPEFVLAYRAVETGKAGEAVLLSRAEELITAMERLLLSPDGGR